jgi:hypothetical protein
VGECCGALFEVDLIFLRVWYGEICRGGAREGDSRRGWRVDGYTHHAYISDVVRRGLMDGGLPTRSYIPSVKRFASDWRDFVAGLFDLQEVCAFRCWPD